jgi:DNA-directed RNA polymerase specialized sigma24 family protein
MSSNKFTQEILKSMTGTVIKTIGFGPNVDDVVSDAVIRVLAGQFDESRGSFKSYCCMVAASTAKNFSTWKSLAPNDARSEGHDDDNDNGVATQLIDDLVGIDGRDVVRASSDSQRLAAAIETLEGDEKIFINALLSDVPATEAVKLTTWKSQADATRKMTSICSKLRHAM